MKLKLTLLFAAVAVVVLTAGMYASSVMPYRVLIVHTGSMGATIPSRSAVIVHKGHYHVGQVVSFTLYGETITHRLVGIRSDGSITTKGDANESVDPSHPPKGNVIGGVVHAPRYLGWVLEYLFRAPTGALSIALFAFCIWQSIRLGDVFDTQEPVGAKP